MGADKSYFIMNGIDLRFSDGTSFPINPMRPMNGNEGEVKEISVIRCEECDEDRDDQKGDNARVCMICGAALVIVKRTAPPAPEPTIDDRLREWNHLIDFLGEDVREMISAQMQLQAPDRSIDQNFLSTLGKTQIDKRGSILYDIDRKTSKHKSTHACTKARTPKQKHKSTQHKSTHAPEGCAARVGGAVGQR